MSLSVEEMMVEIYDAEVNIRIESTWDLGYTFEILGDSNGEFECDNFREGVRWLHRRIIDEPEKRKQ